MSLLKKTPLVADNSDPERELAYSIAQSIYDLRTEQGLSQAQLAERAGTKQPHISVVESATKLPTLSLLLRLANALGVGVRIEFTGKEKKL